MPQATRPAVLALVADLIFAARIQGAARAAGTTVETLRSAADLLARAAAAPPRLILVDLDVRASSPAGVIARLKEEAATAEVPVVAFVSHVREDAIAEARAAGADRVMARSAFVRELPGLMEGIGG